MKLTIYIIAHKECPDKVVEQLSVNERNIVKCYSVNQKFEKKITDKIERINEWELEWFDPSYQDLQYYELSCLPHVVKNEKMYNELSHMGIIHYDTIFKENSIKQIISDLEKTPDQIMYTVFLRPDQIYFSRSQLDNICLFLSYKLKTFIDPNKIWYGGFIGCTKSIAPIWVFKNFGNFMIENKEEIEDILRYKRWGLTGHKMAGFMERLYGFYITSLNLPKKLISDLIQCDWNSYEHPQYLEKNIF